MNVKRIICVKILIINFLLICLLVACDREEKKSSMSRQLPKVSYIIVKPEKVVLKTELPGRVSSFQSAPIIPQVSGLIKKRLFKEGSMVKKGDLLYIIDFSRYEATLDAAKASLEMAQAKLLALEKKCKRFSELIKTKSISQQAYDDTLAALKQLKANIKLYKAQIKLAQINLNYCYIKAPISGKIGKSFITEGATVVAYQPSPLAIIQNFDPVYVDIPRSIAELEELKRKIKYGVLKSGDKLRNNVELILDNGRIYKYKGRLQFEDVTVDKTTGSINLRAIFPNKKYELLPGMFVKAVITEGIKQDAILVPQESVLRDHKGTPYVYVVNDDNKLQIKYIKVDRVIKNKWFVRSGLKSGDKVVVYGIQFIRPDISVMAEPL
ncbi:membrane fusion protein, multidrug efflux system [Desulfonauticus submarinus]|uniref:Membrane fusion protein, multidrug efflux system n=1 Tax=Desulfonauticus submarinus TaxID=206665 RepID=A0A1G9ZNJ2_9BACT|nr:efflux RND transporter periplasmic adaptor subunit [Desulfonauticus submarinus]SDN22246.1 membrane fusion protein, multidrug efflux system [Desulfonauticus submarinus]